MRKMKNKKTGKNVTVSEYIMLKHCCYEYYVIGKNHDDDDTVEILVYGDEIEQTMVSLSGINANIAFRTKDLDSLLPAPGWKWV